MDNGYPFYTIGHGTRGVDEFAEILKSQNIALLVDVRSVPRSRTNPVFNDYALPSLLSVYGIDYIRIPALGGFRPKSKVIPRDTNNYWENDSFHSYADYAMGEEFSKGLNELMMLGAKSPTAIMCAETLWWQCHRRIIADYLLSKGKKVFHIINQNDIEPARLTNNALISLKGAISYPSTTRINPNV